MKNISALHTMPIKKKNPSNNSVMLHNKIAVLRAFMNIKTVLRLNNKEVIIYNVLNSKF